MTGSVDYKRQADWGKSIRDSYKLNNASSGLLDRQEEYPVVSLRNFHGWKLTDAEHSRQPELTFSKSPFHSPQVSLLFPRATCSHVCTLTSTTITGMHPGDENMQINVILHRHVVHVRHVNKRRLNTDLHANSIMFSQKSPCLFNPCNKNDVFNVYVLINVFLNRACLFDRYLTGVVLLYSCCVFFFIKQQNNAWCEVNTLVFKGKPPPQKTIALFHQAPEAAVYPRRKGQPPNQVCMCWVQTAG